MGEPWLDLYSISDACLLTLAWSHQLNVSAPGPLRLWARLETLYTTAQVGHHLAIGASTIYLYDHLSGAAAPDVLKIGCLSAAPV